MKLPCAVEGCNRDVRLKGYCASHQRQVRDGADPAALQPFKRVAKMCSVEGCDHDVMCRGWCQGHYHRWYTGLDTSTLLRERTRGDLPPTCTVDGCERPYWSTGYCTWHYHHLHPSGQQHKRTMKRLLKKSNSSSATDISPST